MKITLKSVACSALEIIIGLIAIIGLVAPLLSGLGKAENGFDIMSLNSPYFFAGGRSDGIKIMIIIFGLLCAFQCTVGAVLLVVGGLNIFRKETEGYGKGITITAIVFIALYMVEGIIYMLVFKNEAGDIRGGVSTRSFVPLIFAVFAFVAYIVCKICLPEKVLWSVTRECDRQDMQTKATVGAGETNEERKLHWISEYFRLYNEGAITKEEYEKEKFRILNGGKGE